MKRLLLPLIMVSAFAFALPFIGLGQFNDGYLNVYKIGGQSSYATYTGTTTNGSTTVSSLTASNGAFTGLVAGMLVTGPGITAPTYLTAAPTGSSGSGSLILSQAAGAGAGNGALTFSNSVITVTATTTSSSKNVTMLSTAGIYAGMTVVGNGVASSATSLNSVSTVTNSTALVLSANASTGVTNGTVTFYTFNIGNYALPVTLDEYKTDGTASTSYTLPFNTTTLGVNDFVVQGNQLGLGLITRSQNGRYITLPGFNNLVGGAGGSVLNTEAIRTVSGSATLAPLYNQTSPSVVSNYNGLNSGGSTNTTNWFDFIGTDAFNAVTDDGTNYWLNTYKGICTLPQTKTLSTYTAPSSGLAAMSTTSSSSTSNRGMYIKNGQLYYTTTASPQGIYKVGTGTPTTASTTSTILFTPASVDVFSFDLSPDGLTLYYVTASNNTSIGGVYRSVNSGTVASPTWSTGTLVSQIVNTRGLAVDWTSYIYSASAGNGAKIYFSTPTAIYGYTDNGTTAVIPTSLKTVSGNYQFRGISFSPIKQTVSLGTNSPAAANLTANTTSNPLFEFNLSADEGNSTIKSVVISNTGTAAIATDFSNFKLYNDANNNGVIDADETTALSTGTISGTTIIFSGITLGSSIAQGSSVNLIVAADIATNAINGHTFIPTIASNQTLNSVNYTTNLINAGGSWVTIGSTVPTGNTLTVTGGVDPPTYSVQPSTSALAICQGTSPSALSVTVTQGTGAIVSYKWYSNTTSSTTGGNLVATHTSTSTTDTYTPQNATLGTLYYYCVVTDANSALVSSNVSGAATVSAPVAPSVSISTTATSFCDGVAITYTATPTNGGAAPTYAWYYNGTLDNSSTSASYTTPAPSIGSPTIKAVLTSNYYCLSATIANSNTASPTVTGVVTPTITNNLATAVTSCNGDLVSLTATVSNAGTSTIQWYKGAAVSIGSGSPLSYTPTNGDVVYATITSNAGGCVSADLQTSTTTTYTVNAKVDASVSVSVPSTNVCASTPITFTATPTNGGATPTYAWYKNSTLVTGQTASTYTLSSPANNDAVYAILSPSSDVCVNSSSVSSGTPITLTTVSSPTLTAIYAYGGVIYSGQTVKVGVNFTSPTATPKPTFQWYNNGVAITGQGTSGDSVYTTSSLTSGNSLTVKITDNNTCTATSAAQAISVLTPTAFTAGNLVVERIGDGGQALTGAGEKVFVDEYTTGTSGTANSASLVSTAQIPYSIGCYPTSANSNYSLTAPGNGTTEGQFSLSADGQFIVLPGYNAPNKATSNTTIDVVNNNPITVNFRSTGVVNANGVASVPSSINMLNSATYRSVVSDGTQLWAVGSAGFYYLSSTADASTAAQSSGVNVRVAHIFNGKLYVSSGSSSYLGVNLVDPLSALSSDAANPTIKNIASTGTGSSPYGFVFSPTGDVLYIADDGAGISKFTTTDGSNYTLAYTVYATNTRGLTADFSGTYPVLYATTTETSANKIVKIIDNTNGVGTATVIANAPTNKVFRGVDFAPSTTQNKYLYINTNYLSNSYTSDYGTTVAGTPVSNLGHNSFAIAGNFLSSNVVITPPVGFEVSLTSNFSTTYTNASPLTITAATFARTSITSTQVVYVRFNPSAPGTFDNNLTIQSTGATAVNIALKGSAINASAFYYKGGTITSTSSWTDNSSLIGGVAPSAMNITGVTWNFTSSGSGTLSAIWTLGTNSSVIIGANSNSYTLTVPSGYPISGGLGINLGAGGSINWNDASISPIFTAIASGSSVTFGAAASQTIPVATYSNIILSGSGTKTFSSGSTYTINNSFSVSSNVVTTTTGSTIYFNGSTTQTIPAITYNNLTSSNNIGCVLAGSVIVNGTLYIEQGDLNVPAAYSLTVNGTSASMAASTSLTVLGTFNNGSTAGTTCATFSQGSGATVSFNYATSMYNHKGNGGSIPTATWHSASSVNVTGISTTIPSGVGQTFGSFVWNCPSQTAFFNVNSSSFKTLGTFSLLSTGTSNLALAGSTSNAYSYTFGGLVVGGTSTTFNLAFLASGSMGSSNITVNGDITVTGSPTINFAGGTTSNTLSNINYGSTITVYGNVSVASTASLYAYNTTATYGVYNHGKIIFAKSGTQTYNYSGTPTGYGKLDLVVNNGTTLQLAGNITQVYNAGAADFITNNGKLDLNGNTLTFNTLTGSGTIKGSSTSGLTINGVASNALTFDQTTLGSSNAIGNLTISNTGTTTIGSVLNIAGILTPTSGTLALGTGLVTLKSTSITNSAVVGVVGGTITGTATVERYIPAKYLGYRDMAPEVYGAGTINANWQEGATNGALNSAASNPHPGYGVFITGPDATYTDASNAGGIDANGFDKSGTKGSLNTQDYTYDPTYTNTTAGYGHFRAFTNTTTTNLDPFTGYRLLIRGDRSPNLYTDQIHEENNDSNYKYMYNATTLRAKGQLVTGDVTYNSDGVVNAASGVNTTTAGTNTHANALNPSPNGFSIVANPYVCPVKWSTVFGTTGTANINGSYWYLDPTYSSTGKYIAYNASTGSNLTATATQFTDPITGQIFTTYNSQSVLGNIQAGQAVFVQSLTASPKVVFQEAAKVASSTKTAVFGTATLSKIYVSLWKQATTASTYNRVDGAAVAFRSDFGNTTYGPQDALKLSGASDNLSISNKGKNLSIDGRLPATANDVIALVISKPSTNAYQLQVDASAYISNGFAPILYDAFKNTTKALSAGITTVDVTIDTAVAASYSNRFSILFAPSALPVNSIVATASLSNKVATINWNTVGEKSVARYEVEKSTDAKTFTTISKATAKNTATANYATTDNSVTTTTYYRIKAVSTTGATSYSNVAKIQLSVNSNQYSVYPNPIKGSTLNLAFDNVTSGKYIVNITNALGQKVVTQTISHTGGSATHALTINSALAAGVYNVTISEAGSKQIVHQTNLSVQP